MYGSGYAQCIVFLQLSWEAIEEMRVRASKAGDPVASSIGGLNLNSNEMTLLLKDPYRPEDVPKKVTEGFSRKFNIFFFDEGVLKAIRTLDIELLISSRFILSAVTRDLPFYTTAVLHYL